MSSRVEKGWKRKECAWSRLGQPTDGSGRLCPNPQLRMPPPAADDRGGFGKDQKKSNGAGRCTICLKMQVKRLVLTLSRAQQRMSTLCTSGPRPGGAEDGRDQLDHGGEVK